MPSASSRASVHLTNRLGNELARLLAQHHLSPTDSPTTTPSPAVAPPTRAELARLVDAVAGPRALGLEVDGSNNGVGWAPVAELVRREACFAVVADPEVLALDCDDPAAAPALKELGDELLAAGHRIVVVASGGYHRFHLFARLGDPVARRHAENRARAAGIDVRAGSPIRPPGVRHRSGRAPELVFPGTWLEARQSLEAPPAIPGRLPSAGWVLLRHGDRQHRYRHPDGTVDDSAVALAVCNMAVNASMSRAQVWRLLLDTRNAGGRSLQKRWARSHLEARRWFDRTWETACRGAWRSAPIAGRSEALAELSRLREAAGRWTFTGRTASSDLTVLDAAFRLAERQGGPVAALAVRAVALESGRTTKTVMASMTRLTALGWLQRVDHHHLDRAASWRITEPPTACQPSHGTSAPDDHILTDHRGRGTVRILRVGPGHDAFACGALGPGAWRVLAALEVDEDQTTRELADRCGLHPGSVRRHLQRLARAGLVETTDDGSWRALDLAEQVEQSTLATVADEAGTAGRSARRRQQFDRERQVYRWELTVVGEILAARERGEHIPMPRGRLAAYVAGRRAPPLAA